MNRLLKGLPLLMLMAVPLCLAASLDPWEWIGKHPEGNMYLDTQHIEKHGDTVVYWVARRFGKPQQSLDGKFSYSELRVKHEVDCQKRTVTFTEMSFWDQAGKLVSGSGPMRQGPKPIEPKGFIVQEADRLCRLPDTPSSGKTGLTSRL